jgi:diguanylate cyclase (GGDEF)-like protein
MVAPPQQPEDANMTRRRLAIHSVARQASRIPARPLGNIPLISKDAARTLKILRVQIKTQTQVWLFALCVTSFSVLISELSVTSIYLLFGPDAFGTPSVVYVAAVIPLVVALPTSYLMGNMGFKLHQAQSTLRRLAETDDLTGLTNRRSFFLQATKTLETAALQQSPISLLIIDVDYFKQLNDTYGHATGDAALKFISQKLEGAIRRSDLACRLGGEEFAILLPDVTESQAQPTAERILSKIAAQPMLHDNKIIEMSVSCGIADTRVSYDITVLFKAADDALYAAKDRGRNKAILYTGSALADQPARLNA